MHVLLTWLQDGIRKAAFVDGIWEVLRLKAQPTVTGIFNTSLAHRVICV